MSREDEARLADRLIAGDPGDFKTPKHRQALIELLKGKRTRPAAGPRVWALRIRSR